MSQKKATTKTELTLAQWLEQTGEHETINLGFEDIYRLDCPFCLKFPCFRVFERHDGLPNEIKIVCKGVNSTWKTVEDLEAYYKGER